jgi:azurin
MRCTSEPRGSLRIDGEQATPAQTEKMMRVIRHVLATAVLVSAAVVFPAAANAADKVCKLAITGTDLMQYDKKELDVAADCTSVEHNWVLVNTPDLSAVANSGMSAGVANNYIDKSDKKVLASTKLVGGGESATVTFPTSILKTGGAYSFLCTFPGHNSVMRGVLKFG